MVDFVRNSPDLLTLMWPNRSSWAAWREFCNKLEAFQAFATAGSWMRTDSGGAHCLSRSVQAAIGRGAFLGLWTTEGLGYYFATAALKQADMPNGLLSGSLALPTRSIIPLHTGMGLAMADRQLGCLTRQHHTTEVRRCLQQYIQLCRDNALEGYVTATIEALGLITRLLRPQMLTTIDHQLAEIDRDLVGPFWHGVGRGLYFMPTNAFPCMSLAWPTFSRARNDPPHQLGRQNAIAGLVWAVTLVNIRDPDVLEFFLARYGKTLDNDAVANGVSSAVSVWKSWSTGSEYDNAICEHVPRKSDAEFLASWSRNARSHCDIAPDRSAIVPTTRPKELFSYRSRRKTKDVAFGHALE